MNISESAFGVMPDGKEVVQYSVENSHGMSFRAITYGATLSRVNVPDRAGKVDNVILGFDTLDDYRERSPFYGALVGRFANRIARGRFVLDGVEYQLACNDVYGAGSGSIANHLHGGNVGFDKVVWSAEGFREADRAGVRWRYLSQDGEEGYPGNLSITATYSLNEEGTLAFEYWVSTDKPTPVNLTNHAYWNLAGAGSGTVFDQQLMFDCPFYLPVDAALMPTGEVLSVAGSPFDFRTTKPIGRDIGKVPGGYDHCLVVRSSGEHRTRLCVAYDPGSGRRMEVRTTKPAVQFYTGNFESGQTGADGKTYGKYGAFTLETEYLPDSVNIRHFPSCILRPGEEYHHLTEHRFTASTPDE